ncbi:family 20 glycosylhydrolase [Parabacteroides gordonii]|jgi:hexosaminidase|uniref:family 20 glycosylhydrolase n=1 Tax=Parabacteroides gordonii TaxID=574930 RepID=UPI00241FFCC5|nr:family 20 glycosylhydrolase [Parabacteroides gordonii]
MKKLVSMCAGAALCILASCSEGPTKQMPYNQGINVIPVPVSLTQNEGVFKVGKNMAFQASTPEAKTVAEFFASKLNLATGYQVTVGDKEVSNGISLIIDESLDVNNEGYTLDVTANGATVKAKTPQGLFYGMQTFMQLLPAEVESPVVVSGIAWTAPCVSVKDEPRFGYRGFMLDPCRHFIPVENVKKQIDVLSLFKINRMHWHLTDDQGWRIEIKKYPKLTEVGAKRIEGEGTEYGGFYTQEEIKEVVKYAADRFVTVIPELELPGHEMAAIAGYPELSCKGEQSTPRIIWGVEDIVMCAGKEETFKFLEDVIDEIAPLFPSEYFHIGGDECPKISWKQCPLCQKRIKEEGLKGDKQHSAEERLQSYFVQRMEKYLADKHGKKIIGWDEILEGGLAPSATVMSWRGEAGGIAAANMDHDVIMTPGSGGMYLDQYQGDSKIEPVTIGGYATIEKVYSYNPIPDTLVATGKAQHILGVQCNNWSEYMYNTDLMEYRMYPRALAVAEIGWSPLTRKDYKDFERRLDNALVRLDAHNINYYIPQPEQPNGSSNFVAFTDKASLAFKTTRPVKVVYTIDGTEPTAESTVYSAPIEFTESGVLKIRSVLPSGKMSKTRTITVEKQALAPAKEVAKTTPGLEMQVTDGMFLESSKLADVKEWKKLAIKDLRQLTNQVPAPESMRGVKQYAAIATGYVNIPEDGVYYISSDNEEVWIDGKLLINNGGEVKRFSRHDTSVALAAGLHEIKVVFLGHIIGGWPSNWNDGSVKLRKEGAEKFTRITPEMLVH